MVDEAAVESIELTKNGFSNLEKRFILIISIVDKWR